MLIVAIMHDDIVLADLAIFQDESLLTVYRFHSLCPLSNRKGQRSGRCLQVVAGGQHSATVPIRAGVPYGSILVPTLFSLYVNDAECCISPDTGLAVYANGTTLYSMIQAITDINTSTESLQQSVQGLEEWGGGGGGERWRISFGPTKSQYMSVSTQRAQWPIWDLAFDGNIPQHNDSKKLLGVSFDTHLSHRNNLRAVTLQANQRIGFFRKASRILNIQRRMATYKGFIRPLLEYAP